MNDAQMSFASVIGAVQRLLVDHISQALTFADGDLQESRSLKIPTPQSLPVCDQLPRCLNNASPATVPLVRAIIEASPYMQWQQSYTLEDGFDAHYLDNYGWFNLISPDGPFIDEKIRLSIGYWGSGLLYKEHWHEPEEMYIPLSGQAVFHSQGARARKCGPGDTVIHQSNQPHSIDIDPGPLLAMALWRGANLNRKPGLAGH